METPTPIMQRPRVAEGTPLLRAPGEGEDLVANYQTLGLTLGRHPLVLLRKQFDRIRLCTAADNRVTHHGTFARAAGLLINRQRRILLHACLLVASGTVERDGEVVHLIAGRLEDHSRLLGKLGTKSRDFQ